MPLPSRRVLGALLARTNPAAATLVGRALDGLLDALEAHEAALSALDRLEEALVATHGHPRVPLPAAPGASIDHASEPGTIDRRVGPGPEGRRLKAELRRRQRNWQAAGAAAGLPRAQNREATAARELEDAAAAVLVAPVRAAADLRVKLVVLIAAGEAGPAEAAAFPWWCLRVLLADAALLAGDPAQPPGA